MLDIFVIIRRLIIKEIKNYTLGVDSPIPHGEQEIINFIQSRQNTIEKIIKDIISDYEDDLEIFLNKNGNLSDIVMDYMHELF